MATLHLVNRPAAFADCAVAAAPGDTILCYENGVLACLTSHTAIPAVAVVALRHDVDAMGIVDLLNDAVGVVDDAGFVDLVARHSPIVSWS